MEQRVQEQPYASAQGYLMAILGTVVITAACLSFPLMPWTNTVVGTAVKVLMLVLGIWMLSGLYMLQPNEAALLTLFGSYRGTDRREGLRWTNPFMKALKISLRSRNLNVPTLKVNDKRGNPVEISAVVVWRVRNTAQAVFEVDQYETYVSLQAEAALRSLASQYAYDFGEDLQPGEPTLLQGGVVLSTLIRELQDRFHEAGVEVMEAKLSHLAYAPEIAQVMLRRQQAEAVISARSKIVHGAVSMVEDALKGLSERGIVNLDDERRAAMVSNLLVVLCSDRETQPIVNTGTLYN
jgi:hypothetical protein